MKKYLVKIDGIDLREITSNQRDAEIAELGDGSFHLLLNGQGFHIEVISTSADRKHLELTINGSRHSIEIQTDFDQFIEDFRSKHQVIDWHEFLEAPMPGKIIDIFIEPGQKVKKGEKLLLLEAMKMENVITAPSDEIIEEVLKHKGDTIQKNEKIIRFAPLETNSA